MILVVIHSLGVHLKSSKINLTIPEQSVAINYKILSKLMAETQKIFNHLSTLIFLVCAIYFKLSVSAYTLLHKHKSEDSHNLPEYQQVIFVPLVTGAMCYIYKKAVIQIMSPAFLLIVKDQHDKNLAKARAEKASIAFAKTCYYVCNSIWAYGLIKDTNFMPWYLGGKGSIENCFENAPLTP
jgi:hypothetical protein